MVEVAMLKCVTILNVLLLALGTDARSVNTKAPRLMCQRTIWAYEFMDAMTYPALSGVTVA
jgi:hypothetical protein